jgi:hypothetical protein
MIDDLTCIPGHFSKGGKEGEDAIRPHFASVEMVIAARYSRMMSI